MSDQAPPSSPLPAAACRNCGEPFGAPWPRFCPACGQESNLRPPTIGEFLQQFGGSYLATEGALWRTLKLLLLKPGELTRQYLAGRRKHYVLPLRLYLTISVIVLVLLRVTGAVQWVGGDALEGAPAAKPSHQNLQIHLGGNRQAGLKEGVFYCQELPGWLCRRLQQRIDLDPRAMAERWRLVSERIAGNLGTAMFVLMPAFALGLRLLYWNRPLRYTEHLVFALHLHAFWFMALACMMVGVDMVIAAAMLAIPVYGLLAMRRVYGGHWGPRLLRAALLSAVYLLLIVLAAVAGMLAALLA